MPARKTPSAGKKPDKLIRDALMVAINREAKNAAGVMTKKLFLFADKVVEEALAGNERFAQMLCDRIEGKAMQPVEIGEDKVVIITIRKFTDGEEGDWDKEVAAAEAEIDAREARDRFLQ